MQSGVGRRWTVSEESACRTLIRLYVLQAEQRDLGAGGWPPLADDDPGPEVTPTPETAYAAGLVADARQASGCSCAELLAAGYALRQWGQRRSLAEQQAWHRAGQCPHLTLVDGLASAAFTGPLVARDWYTLAATLRRVTLPGSSRTHLINDYVIEWFEEHTGYLV
jgi:hypothetical protein